MSARQFASAAPTSVVFMTSCEQSIWLAHRVLGPVSPDPTKKRPRIAGASRFHTAWRAGAFFCLGIARVAGRRAPARQSAILVLDATAEAANQVSNGEGHRGSRVRALLYGCTQKVIGLAGAFAD